MNFFFESKFVRLSWEYVLELHPAAVAVAVDRNGIIYSYEEKPWHKGNHWDGIGAHRLIDANQSFDNWRDLLFMAPICSFLPRSIVDAIRLLHPSYEWLAVDSDEEVHLFIHKPHFAIGKWIASEFDMPIEVDVKPYSEAEHSLVKLSFLKRSVGNTP